MVASGLVGFAERNRALAQAAPDYRAVVGVFQQGGNDGENMLVRYDAAGYKRYSAVRPPASSLNIPQAQLAPIQPSNVATPYGFHPACAPLKALFDQKQLAVIANVGALAVPRRVRGSRPGRRRARRTCSRIPTWSSPCTARTRAASRGPAGAVARRTSSSR